MSITSKVVSLNPVHDEVYTIVQHYVIKFVSDLIGQWFSPGPFGFLQSWTGIKHITVLVIGNDSTGTVKQRINKSPLGQEKSGLLRQVTSDKMLNSDEIFHDRLRKRCPFNTYNCLIEVTTYTSLTVNVNPTVVFAMYLPYKERQLNIALKLVWLSPLYFLVCASGVRK